jgi:hypothetical protein
MSTTLPSGCFQNTSESATSKPSIFPDNIQFWYETKRAFGAASYGASEFGEVLATVYRITSGDFDSWYSEWNATAKRIKNGAEQTINAWASRQCA